MSSFDKKALDAYIRATDQRVEQWSVADQEAFRKATRDFPKFAPEEVTCEPVSAQYLLQHELDDESTYITSRTDPDGYLVELHPDLPSAQRLALARSIILALEHGSHAAYCLRVEVHYPLADLDYGQVNYFYFSEPELAKEAEGELLEMLADKWENTSAKWYLEIEPYPVLIPFEPSEIVPSELLESWMADIQTEFLSHQVGEQTDATA